MLKYRTPIGPPTGFITLSLVNVDQRSATLTWNEPQVYGAKISKYEVTSTNALAPDTVRHWQGLLTQITVSNLISFTYYTFYVTSCTEGKYGGCITSDPLKVITKKDAPQQLAAPNVTAVSATQLSVRWLPPALPNGMCVRYTCTIFIHVTCSTGLYM